MQAFRFAKRNIRRSPFQALAACMTMFMTFFALAIFLILAWGSQVILKYYESKPQVIVFFKDGTQESEIAKLQNVLAKDDRITKIKYVSKEEALKIYHDQNKTDPTLLELVTANMLPSSIEVSTNSPQDLKPIAEALKIEPVISDILLPEDVVKNLTVFTSSARLVGMFVVGYLILFSLLIILMIIGFKIRLKKDEIAIMRLVGAPSSFIRNPFLLEGIFYGVFGAISSWVMAYIFVWYITPFVQQYIAEIKLLPISPIFMLALLGVELLGALIIGIIGSYGAVRRYLRI